MLGVLQWHYLSLLSFAVHSQQSLAALQSSAYFNRRNSSQRDRTFKSSSGIRSHPTLPNIVMVAVDPTYPLFPAASFLAAALLFLSLFTAFIRQSWNLGVTFLCFWLLIQNITNGVNAIVWSDNAEIRLYVYCDIVTRLQLLCLVVKSTATLSIVRRLYLIASLKSVEPPSSSARRWDMLIEWTLGLFLPLLVAGPLYYVVQAARFQVYEGFGCINADTESVLTFLLVPSWAIIFSLVSIIVYYPKVAYTFYCHSRDINQFLRSNNSVSRTHYFRVLVLASIDILLTLPLGATNLILNILSVKDFSLPFYTGWEYVHTDWWPVGIPYADWTAGTLFSPISIYFTYWSSPVLAFAIFALFGMSEESLACYQRGDHAVGRWFGWRPSLREEPSMGEMVFGARPQEISLDIALSSSSRPSSINFGITTARGDLERVDSQCPEEQVGKFEETPSVVPTK